MEVCDRLSLHDPAEAPDAETRATDDLMRAEDLMQADELISDLQALVDAGVVVVHEHVLGPPRYGPCPAW